jgi:hypothetical protein
MSVVWISYSWMHLYAWNGFMYFLSNSLYVEVEILLQRWLWRIFLTTPRLFISIGASYTMYINYNAQAAILSIVYLF